MKMTTTLKAFGPRTLSNASKKPCSCTHLVEEGKLSSQKKGKCTDATNSSHDISSIAQENSVLENRFLLIFKF